MIWIFSTHFHSSPSTWIFCYKLVSIVKKAKIWSRISSNTIPNCSQTYLMSYKERLAKIEPHSIKYHRVHTDTMTNKILNGYNLKLEYILNVDTNWVTRGHNLKLKRLTFSLWYQSDMHYSHGVTLSWKVFGDVIYYLRSEKANF